MRFQIGIYFFFPPPSLFGSCRKRVRKVRTSKALDQERSGDAPLLGLHVQGDGQQHEHIVAVRHAHGIQVRKDVGCGDAALRLDVTHQWVEKVCRLG